jgi:deoxyinosine 3'endonuclease (endonuclease V)
LGVVNDIPTVGVAKTFMHVDGLSEVGVRSEAGQKLKQRGDAMDIVGESKRVHGSVEQTFSFLFS